MLAREFSQTTTTLKAATAKKGGATR